MTHILEQLKDPENRRNYKTNKILLYSYYYNNINIFNFVNRPWFHKLGLN